MLRRPGSPYEIGRSSSLLKVKTFHDAEATVIVHAGGTEWDGDAVQASTV